MRVPFWPEPDAAPTLEPNRRVIKLKGIEPLPFETHGQRDIYISRSIDRSGMWEETTTSLMAELLRKDADLVDVGANIGWYSVVAGHYLGSRGEIHSFEPDKRNLELLRRNVALSSLTNVRVNAFALSDGDRSELLSLDADNLGDHRLGARDGYAFVHVNARALDGYAGIRRRPLVIKLDVQGSELDVLRGCSKLLRHHPEEIVLLCEICSMLDDRGARLDDLCELFIENGFVAAVLNQQTRSIRPEGWQSLRRRWGAMRLADAALAEDIVLFRRFDGLMKALLDCGLRKVEKT